MHPSETKELALERKLPGITPERLDAAFLEELARYGCQYAIVVAYGKILPQSILDLFPMGVLNVHYSLLPKYRGASPVEQALLNGETETGVTIQRMVLKMDAGDIVTQQSIAIDPDETIRELRPKLVQLGSELLINTLPDYLAGTAPVTPQDESAVTTAPKIRKQDGCLSLKDDPEENWRKYRAYAESPGTFFYAKKGDKSIRVKILDAVFFEGAFMVRNIVPESKATQDFALLIKNGWEAE